MQDGDLENSLTASLGQGEIVAYTEQHQCADGLGQKACGLCNNRQNAQVIHHSANTADIQSQTQKAHDHQRRGHHFLHHLGSRGILSCVRGKDGNHRNGYHRLGQIQDAHAVSLIRTKENHKQRDTQHTGFLGTEQLGQIVIGKFLSAISESPQGAQQYHRQNQCHTAYGFRTDPGRQAGIEECTGQADFHNKGLKALDIFRCNPIFTLGQHTKNNRREDGSHHLRHGYKHIHR